MPLFTGKPHAVCKQQIHVVERTQELAIFIRLLLYTIVLVYIYIYIYIYIYGTFIFFRQSQRMRVH